jgi:hypothetical protein
LRAIAPYLACFCAFSCLSLCVFVPPFAPNRVCICTYSCLPMNHFLHSFAPFLACLCLAMPLFLSCNAPFVV